MLFTYSMSMFKLLTSIYTEYEWLPWRFSRAPPGFWSDPLNQRKFMDWAAKELKINKLSDWHQVRCRDLDELGGKTLLKKHNYSVTKVLQDIYPEHDWLSWTYENNTMKAVQQNETIDFIEYAAKQLNIKELKDWENITAEVKNKGFYLY